MPRLFDADSLQMKFKENLKKKKKIVISVGLQSQNVI